MVRARWLALFAVVGLAYLPRLDDMCGLFSDDAWYVLLARALATGKGYTLTNLPTPGIAPVYPPGFPLLPHGDRPDRPGDRSRTGGVHPGVPDAELRLSGARPGPALRIAQGLTERRPSPAGEGLRHTAQSRKAPLGEPAQ